MAQPVVHFEIMGKDGKRSREFYSKLFDWEFQVWEGSDYGLVKAAGENSIGGGVGSSENGATMVTVYVQVEDLQAALDKAESLGGKTCVPPTPIPGMGAFAMFTDPDGNTVGLFQG